MSAKAGKRPLRSLTAHEKLDAIRRVHDGESKASVARDIGVPESTLRGWCKNEDKISYLSRQSTPDTDDSLIELKEKKLKTDDTLQPYNLSLKNTGSPYSPNTEIKFSPDAGKADYQALKPDKYVLNLNIKPDTPKSSLHMSERERNRAELARLSVELGLNRPEMFAPNANGSSNNITDLSTNIGLLTQWNNILAHQQKTPNKKITAPADTSSNIVTSSGVQVSAPKVESGQKPAKPTGDAFQSIDESLWYWLKTQQAMLGIIQNQNGLLNSIPVPNTVSNTSTINTSTPSNSVPVDQNSSWFWKWYKQFSYTPQQTQSQVPDKPILYQQLTKDKDVNNLENIKFDDTASVRNNTKARAVLDNLLLNNNNNLTHNKKEVDDYLDQTEALEHGEKFLKWLECCSEPSVTAMQIMQFRYLLNNIKCDVDRKNGDLQNKTKVKRK